MRLKKRTFRYYFSVLGEIVFDKFAGIFINDEFFLKIKWRLKMGSKLDLTNPSTFNEKLQWLKLFYRKPIQTKMVDKVDAKQYVEQLIGKDYIIPTIGIYNDVHEVNWEKLPKSFVIKCAHDSAGVVVCCDKKNINIEEAKKKLQKGLGRSYYKTNREWPYKNVPRRIICEQYLVDDSGYELKDYKFFCFNGKVKLFKIDFDRTIGHKANYYDINGNILSFGETICPPDFNKQLVLPSKFDDMIKIAERLSNGFPFLRVDLYNVRGQIYFGELTFFPASGFGTFTDYKWDEKMGEWISLPLKN